MNANQTMATLAGFGVIAGAGMIAGGAVLCSGQSCLQFQEEPSSPSVGAQVGTPLLIVGVGTVIASVVLEIIAGHREVTHGETVPASSDADADAALARAKQQAAAALARDGHCATVKTIANQVRSLDEDYYSRVFVLEPAIAACLSAAR